MDLSIYLAFASAELGAMHSYEGKTAWLGCQLSPYSSGITHHPASLTHCDMLILTDETPPGDHDAKIIAQELMAEASALSCEKILLDFQRKPSEESLQIVDSILKVSSLPVGVTAGYAKDFSCPVFLSPPPLWTPLSEHLEPWKDYEIWLEFAPESSRVTLTTEGCFYSPSAPLATYPLTSKQLHLDYKTELKETQVNIHLHRSISHMESWLLEAQALGVHSAIGLYQLFSGF